MNIKMMIVAFVCMIHQCTASSTFSQYFEKIGRIFYKHAKRIEYDPSGYLRNVIVEPKLKNPKEIWHDNPRFVIISGVILVCIASVRLFAFILTQKKKHHQQTLEESL
jgi:hypothetical protein